MWRESTAAAVIGFVFDEIRNSVSRRNDTRRLTLRHRLPNDLVNPSQHRAFESSRVAHAATLTTT